MPGAAKNSSPIEGQRGMPRPPLMTSWVMPSATRRTRRCASPCPWVARSVEGPPREGGKGGLAGRAKIWYLRVPMDADANASALQDRAIIPEGDSYAAKLIGRFEVSGGNA